MEYSNLTHRRQTKTSVGISKRLENMHSFVP